MGANKKLQCTIPARSMTSWHAVWSLSWLQVVTLTFPCLVQSFAHCGLTHKRKLLKNSSASCVFCTGFRSICMDLGLNAKGPSYIDDGSPGDEICNIPF